MAYLGREAAKAPLVSSDIPDDSITAAKIVDSTIAAGDLAANSVDSSELVDGSIDTSHIADNQVTLAKMAGGTDGQIITYDASGDPVAVGPGTDGQVLTSTGAGSPPAFEAVPAAAGGGLTHLATVTLSGSSSTGTATRTLFSDTYQSYWIVISSARITTGAGEVRMRYSTDASTDLTNVYYNVEAQGRTDAGTVTGYAYDDADHIELNTNQKVGPKTTGFAFVINGARDSGAFTVMHGSGHTYPEANYHFGFQMTALYEDTPTISGFNLYGQSAGNFTGGICSVFGIKES